MTLDDPQGIGGDGILRIGRQALEAARRHAAGDARHEVAGLLAAGDGRIVAVVPLPNEQGAYRNIGVAVTVATWEDGLRRIRDAGLSAVGAYHSHPTGPTGLSAGDRDLLARPSVQMLIAFPGRPQERVGAWLFPPTGDPRHLVLAVEEPARRDGDPPR